MRNITLNNGVEIPILGFGVYQIAPEECERCVLDAIDVGYRSFDTAQVYGNEREVGHAVALSGLPREDFFLTSKIWISNTGYDKAKQSVDDSLNRLGTDYIDLMLIHQPFGDYYGAYRALEEALEQEKVRAIGVSNFAPDRLIDLCHHVSVIPALNQVETHVFYQQEKAQKYMRRFGIGHESWGPFAEGKNQFFTNPVLSEIGKKYGKTAAQVGLRFLIQKDIIAIPKSVRKEKMAENFDVFDFELGPDDMKSIKRLDENKSVFASHVDPDFAEILVKIKI